mmetsp:Transcript_48548/g.143462  ORF Transcript_48548/g.143462 Transcript_48548/m.143462 type:complete len:207 (+) Transcript_48548:161-781(+)
MFAHRSRRRIANRRWPARQPLLGRPSQGPAPRRTRRLRSPSRCPAHPSSSTSTPLPTAFRSPLAAGRRARHCHRRRSPSARLIAARRCHAAASRGSWSSRCSASSPPASGSCASCASSARAALPTPLRAPSIWRRCSAFRSGRAAIRGARRRSCCGCSTRSPSSSRLCYCSTRRASCSTGCSSTAARGVTRRGRTPTRAARRRLQS